MRVTTGDYGRKRARSVIVRLGRDRTLDWRDPAIVPMTLGDPGAVELKGLRVAVYTDNGIMTPTVETIETVNSAAKALSDAETSVREDLPDVIGLY